MSAIGTWEKMLLRAEARGDSLAEQLKEARATVERQREALAAAQAYVDAEVADSLAVEALTQGLINSEWQAATRKLADDAFAALRAALSGEAPQDREGHGAGTPGGVESSSSPAAPPDALTDEAARQPTAITGTWNDIEAHARYVYFDEGVPGTPLYDFAEAILVLLGSLGGAAE